MSGCHFEKCAYSVTRRDFSHLKSFGCMWGCLRDYIKRSITIAFFFLPQDFIWFKVLVYVFNEKILTMCFKWNNSGKITK